MHGRSCEDDGSPRRDDDRVDPSRRRLLTGAAGAVGAWWLGHAAPSVAQALTPRTTATALGIELNGKTVAWVQRIEGGVFQRTIADELNDSGTSDFYFDAQRVVESNEPANFSLVLYGMSSALLGWIRNSLKNGPAPDLALFVADQNGLEVQRILLPAPVLTQYRLEPVDMGSSEPVRVRIRVNARPRYRPGSGRAVGPLALVEQPLQSNARLLINGLDKGSAAIASIGATGIDGWPMPPLQNQPPTTALAWRAVGIDVAVDPTGFPDFFGWLDQYTAGTTSPLLRAAQLQLMSADRKRLLGTVDCAALSIARVEPPVGGPLPATEPMRARFQLHPIAPPLINLSGMVTRE